MKSAKKTQDIQTIARMRSAADKRAAAMQVIINHLREYKRDPVTYTWDMYKRNEEVLAADAILREDTRSKEPKEPEEDLKKLKAPEESKEEASAAILREDTHSKEPKEPEEDLKKLKAPEESKEEASAASEAIQEKPKRKVVRRPNQMYPLDQPPPNVSEFKICEVHQVYTLHNCTMCVVAKREETTMKRHGVAHYSKKSEFRDIIRATTMERYGTQNYAQTDEYKERAKKTNLERYGVQYSLQSKEVREKGLATMEEKYGVKYTMQSQVFKDIAKKSCLERFGVEYAAQSEAVKEGRRQTIMDRYGTTEVLKVPEIQERIRQTMIATYGKANPLQNEEIKARKDATCVERYGTANMMAVAEIFEKKQKAAFNRKVFTLPSGKEILFQGYEDVALRKLLETLSEEEFTNDVKTMPKITYMYQEKPHRYYPDLYIPSQKKIIEVKSTYTYQFHLEKNQMKKAQCIADGYAFEFWICSDKEILEVL